MGDVNVDLPAYSQTTGVQVSEVFLDSYTESHSDEVEMLSIGNLSSNISNISNIFKESMINFNPVGM